MTIFLVFFPNFILILFHDTMSEHLNLNSPPRLNLTAFQFKFYSPPRHNHNRDKHKIKKKIKLNKIRNPQTQVLEQIQIKQKF